MSQTQTTPYNILIVDDTPHNLTVLRQILSQQGYRIRPAINGEVALKAVQMARPDLILLDIMMAPGMNGYEVCRLLKADPATQEIPILFISALDETVDKIKAFKVGGVDYITKPFQTEEVLARVETHLKLHAMQVQLREHNEQLRLAKDMAESANRAKSVFLANMSHEFRTPLNAILGFAQLLRSSPHFNGNERQNLEIITRSGEHLLTLINQVLDLSKIEAGRMSVTPTPFELESMLEDVIDMFRLRAERKGLTLLFKKMQNVPAWVNTDVIKFRQVLLNLLSNAFKFTDTGSVAVRVSADSWPTEPKHHAPQLSATHSLHLCVEVEDTGPGIEADELNAIFEAFTQTKVGQAVQEGTGLGLSISRKFAHMLGGEISVTSQVGQGSTFLFTIPVTAVEPPPLISPSERKHITGLASGQPCYRILIVDSAWDNRQLLLKILAAVGFETREAQNGLESLKIWESWEPDLIFIENRMSKMNGYQLARRIREAERAPHRAVSSPRAPTVIIALSATSFEEERTIALSNGCQDFLRKPFRESDIFDVIQQHLGVEYVYDMSPVKDGTSARTMPSDSPLPQPSGEIGRAQKEQLEYAATTADIGALFRIIEEVSETHPHVAEELRTLAQNFDYVKILSTLRELKTDNRE